MHVRMGLILIYAVVCILAWLAADSMIFVPQYGSRSEPEGAVKIVSKSRVQLSALHFPNPAAKFT
ncbi:MAG: alpha/beta hydrolase, partial [Opitutus sp.]